MAVQVKIPSLGESVTEAILGTWLAEEGQAIAVDEVIFELESDKANMEIAAETAVPAVIEEGRPDNIPNLIGCPQSQCGDLLLTERMLQVPDAR